MPGEQRVCLTRAGSTQQPLSHLLLLQLPSALAPDLGEEAGSQEGSAADSLESQQSLGSLGDTGFWISLLFVGESVVLIYAQLLTKKWGPTLC